MVPTAPGAAIIVAPMPRARVRNTAAYMMGLPCARGRDGLPGDGKAFVECVMAFILSLGFQLKHKATCSGGGCVTRHSHYVRVRLDFRAGDAGQREIAQDCPGPDPDYQGGRTGKQVLRGCQAELHPCDKRKGGLIGHGERTVEDCAYSPGGPTL